MSYLVLARKYRPAGFDAVAGQSHVTKTLRNAISRGKVGHAYLFAGPRGVGKTTISRVFAKALNCVKGPTPDPCLTCRNCLEIAAGTSLAVREMDGASNNSVDDVRSLIDSFRSVPPPGSAYKVYIVDEVHMLSLSAFNALLKSLEEPPPSTVFVLATTEVQKIPETVVSRCQRFDLRALPAGTIEARLSEVAAAEGVRVEPGALRLIARTADGSMRDAQSYLDRVISFCEGAVTEAETAEVLGTASGPLLSALSAAILARDPAEALRLVDRGLSSGADPAVFLREFVTHWRELFLVRFGGEAAVTSFGMTAEEARETAAVVADVPAADLRDLVDLARSGADDALRSYHPRYAFESLVVRLATRVPVADVADLIARLGSAGQGAVGAGARRPAPGRPSAPNGPPAVPPPCPVPDDPPAGRSGVPGGDAASGEVPPPPGDPIREGARVRDGDWPAVVRELAGGPARQLAEYVKRIAVERFAPGVLVGRAPDFYAVYFEKPENRKKLVEALAGVTGHGEWRVTIGKGGAAAAADPATVLAAEEEERRQKTRAHEDAVLGHPGVRTMKQAFPGSKVQIIKPKE